MKYDTEALETISAEVRKGIFETVKSAKSGHIGGCSSSVELMAGLYFGHLNYDTNNSKHPSRDRVLVRGHLGPLRYKIFSMLDWMDKSELKNYRKIDSILEGHEKIINSCINHCTREAKIVGNVLLEEGVKVFKNFRLMPKSVKIKSK